MALTGPEVFFGGSGGGGKSDSLLMAALQFVQEPNYAALLLRKSYSDLNQPGALIPRSIAWLAGTDARWSGQNHTWTFPSGSVLKFGYLDTEIDKYQYQSSEFAFVGWDEVSQFAESDYRYLFSRLRRPKGGKIPLRMRSASNPGGRGHSWCKRRFIDEGLAHGRIYVPARLEDNPHIDRTSYLASLSQLDPVTRAQIERGDWSARAPGSMFKREWFKIISEAPADIKQWCRFWDMAATEPEPGKEPDWTAGPLVGLKDGQYFVRDMRRFRRNPKGNEDAIKQTAQLDPYGVIIRMEQEPGASGKSSISHYQRNVLVGYNFSGVPAHKDKPKRAAPVSSAAEAGNVYLIDGPWIGDFLDEAEAFPDGSFDDQIDGLSGAFDLLGKGMPIWVA